jgi:transposase
MWTAQNRRGYDRSQLRYPSDLTGEEWARVEPLIPPAWRGGNKRHVDVREVMNGIMYILSTGCQWRAIPKDLRRAQHCSTIWICGAGTARSIAFITRFMWSATSTTSAKPARPPPSSIAKA